MEALFLKWLLLPYVYPKAGMEEDGQKELIEEAIRGYKEDWEY